MQVTINRVIYPNGTNGTLTIDNEFICYTIELTWKDNKRRVSCIAPGTYTLVDHTSAKFGRVAYVKGTQPQRDYVYFHAANDAKKRAIGMYCTRNNHNRRGEGVGIKNCIKVV